MAWWTSDDLAEVYRRMLATGAEFVVVGGQAVNLWSEHFRARSSLLESEWAQLLPFASHDLDCFGGGGDATDIARSFGVEAIIYDPFGKAWAPNSATFHVEIAGRELHVHFLHTVYGATQAEVRRTARRLPWGNSELPVMHPLVCFESKIECLFHLDQRGRQDLKHVQLSRLACHEFLRDRLGFPRDVLQVCERLARLACSQSGLRLHWEHGIACESAIPLAAIAEGGVREPKLAHFTELRWPALLRELARKRERFREVVERLRANEPPRP